MDDTNILIRGIPPQYREELQGLLDSHGWHYEFVEEGDTV